MNSISNWCIGIFLLIALVGCDQERKHARVLVIHSFQGNDKTYPELNAAICRELREKDICADIRTFYLNSEAYQSREEEARMFQYIDTIQRWKPDLILVNDDQAVYSLMKCGHPFVKAVPVVFAGVNYPNWELLKEYPNVTGSWDKCDYRANLDFIEKEFGKSRVYINYDRTVLGRLAFYDFVDGVNQDRFALNFNGIVRYVGNKRFGFDAVRDSLEQATIAERPEKTLINFMPFRDAPGQILLAQVSGAFPYCVFLNIRYDHTSSGLAKMFNTPSFTTVREIFGIEMEVLGGYFCSNEGQAKAQVAIASEILGGKSPRDIPITESPKEYLYDWRELKRLGIRFQNVPEYIRIVNLPFYVRYQTGLIIAGTVFGCLIFFVIANLMFLYTRETKRRKLAWLSLSREKERLSIALERAEEADRMKSAFLANMSHEIRTPLNAIVGFSNLMHSEIGLEPEERDQFAKLINTNSDLLLKLINDILDLSRIESGKMDFTFEDFNLNDLMEEVYRTHKLMMPVNVEFRRSVPVAPVIVNVDQYRLRQVLTNFINNAVKFTSSGYIEVGYRADDKGTGLLIYVKDTGIGIPAENLQKVFERFCKLDEFAQGTGLGLAICQVIASRFGGEIRLASVYGEGSCFGLVLPKERIC